MSQGPKGIADGCAVSPHVIDQSPNSFQLEPRCRVCRHDAVRRKVNDLLATGTSYAMVLRSLPEDNGKLDASDRVTVDSIRNHCSRHFPAQSTARAVYREVLERRAKEANIDFVDGVATALTPIAVLECIMIKGYETLVEADTKVDVSTAMAAAGKLQSIIDSREGQGDIAGAYVKMNRIIETVRSLLPQELWPELVRRLEGDTESSTAAAEVQDDDDVDYGLEDFVDDDYYDDDD